jgi:hypothetical protein
MRRYSIFTAACLLTLGLGGSAAAQRDSDRNDNRERQEDRWVRGKVGPQWELMTKQVVNFRDDRDHINVGNAGRHNGRFSRIMIRADGAPVEIRRMVINFDNGEKFEAIGQRTRLDQNSGGFVIDLPGHRRDIDSIDLNYFSVHPNQPGGKGTLLVYGTGGGGQAAGRQSERQDNRWQRGRVGADWELMTKQVVNFRDDRDHINVGNGGRHNGRFSRIMIRAENAPVEIRRMVINFDNGEKFEAINQRTRLDQNSGGLVIDLPGHRRDIDSLDLNYFSVNNSQSNGRGTLLVYGTAVNRQAYNR